VQPMQPMQPQALPSRPAQHTVVGGSAPNAGPAAPMTAGAPAANAGQDWTTQAAHPGQVGAAQLGQPVSGQASWDPQKPIQPPPGTTGDPGHRTSLNVTPNKLVIPQFLPIFDPNRPSGVIPFATELNAPGDTATIDFEIPRGPLGPFVVIGAYFMLCAPAEDVAAGDHPIVWMDPDVGVFSDIEGTPVAPPDHIGPRAGDRFEYSLELANDLLLTTHHGHLNNNLRTIPLPVQVPSGAQGRLTVVRLPSARFRDGEPVYLLAGLFGRLHHTVVPPFPLDACRVPVRPASFTTGSQTIAAPGPGVPLGSLGPVTQLAIDVTEQFPTVFSHLLYSGADHLFMRFSWQVGQMMQQFVPAKVFEYITAGGWLPAPVLTNGSTSFSVELAQAAVVANQTDQTAAVDIEGASYGF